MTKQKGLVIVWTDIPAELEYEFNEWYNREHMRERILGINGFICGRRFVAAKGAPKYLATYEAHTIEVLLAEQYRALVRNPDPLSRKFIPRFQNTIKGICDIVAEAGEAQGAVVAMLPMTRTQEGGDGIREWLERSLMAELMRKQGVVAVRYAHKNANTLAAATAEHMRPTDTFVDALLMIEAVSRDDLEQALPLVGSESLAAHGARADGEACVLNVIYTLHVPPTKSRDG